jgi:PhzF family phenazine biosynthesis protein
MQLSIYQVDAFTETIFNGNPAAVIPLQEWLEAGLMQKIAMENNLSETAYFVKTDKGFHIRWFTPEFEIDLCGHATLASAYVIKNFIEPELQVINFSTEKAGDLKVTAEKGWYILDFPSRMPVKTTVPDQLLKSLNIDNVIEVLKSRDYFVVVPDEQTVIALEPDFNLIKELDAVGVIVTAKGRSADVVSRCFYPGAGIPEDPVTGSAHCNIIPYWAAKLNKLKLECLQLSARGGKLWCELKNDRVLMKGKCVLFMKGTVDL